MRTSEEIYHRVRWDPRFDPARFVLGVNSARRRAQAGPAADLRARRRHPVAPGAVRRGRRRGGVGPGRRASTGSTRSGAGRVREAAAAAGAVLHRPDAVRLGPATGWRPAERARSRATATGPAADLEHAVGPLRQRPHRHRPPLAAAAGRPGERRRRRHRAAGGRAGAAGHAAAPQPWVRDGYTLDTDPRGRDVDGERAAAAQPAAGAGGRAGTRSARTRRSPRSPWTTGRRPARRRRHPPDQRPHRRRRRRAGTRELARLAEGSAGVEADVVLLGDFNDGSDRARPTALGMRDAWSRGARADDATPTFDPGANPLAAVSSLSGRAARLDRVLLRGAGVPGDRRPRSAGTTPATPDGLFVSDHYGVRGRPASGRARRPPRALDVAPTARTARGVAAAAGAVAGDPARSARSTTRRSTAGRRT